MIHTVFDIRAVAITDPKPPPQELDPLNRQILIVQIMAMSPVAPPMQLMLAGESLPMLIKILQEVCQANPALTTERAEQEGVEVAGEDLSKMVEGPERPQ